LTKVDLDPSLQQALSTVLRLHKIKEFEIHDSLGVFWATTEEPISTEAQRDIVSVLKRPTYFKTGKGLSTHEAQALAEKVKNDLVSDPVNNPSHYTDGNIEVIEFIEDKNLGFHIGNVVKYVTRAGKKDRGAYIEDLKKAAWYLHRFIEVEKARLEKRKPLKPNQTVKQ
jgi:hypothetical protein